MGIIRILTFTAMTLIVITVGIFLLAGQPDITGRAVEKTYLHTKAICNETEKGPIYCEDYEITCEGNETTSVVATGFSVFHDEDWEDPRGEGANGKLCG